ncbi:MAG TPA: DHH family phosphoesterase, partial [Verrucomicrobiota bacterium]|nr:DHH family phosphoesterase [Verrucomicrobiota bacterium]
MTSLPTPEVILTHESDLDGFVAGHLLLRLARRLSGTAPRFEAWNTNAWQQRPLREASPPRGARLDRPGWVVVDHHPLLARPARAQVIHDPAKSAALLCYGLCREHGLGSPALDRLVHLTNVGDLFLEEHADFVEAQDYAALLKLYPFWGLSRFLGGELEALLEHPLLEVVRTRRRVEDPLGLAWSRERITEVTPGLAVVDVAVGNANLIVHDLLRERATPHPVLATVAKRGGGWVASFRSRDGTALELAAKFRGGGHPNAA